MRKLLVGLLVSCGMVWAQDAMAAGGTPKPSKDEITIQGCVGRSGGDYILTKKDPAITYELQATGKTRLKNYMGQRVEVTGKESASLSTSSDAINKTGSAAPVTLTVRSIRTVDKDCAVREGSDH